MDSTTMYIMDGFIALAAVYLLYLGIKMKVSGQISKSIMNPETLAKCKNKDGFIGFIFPRLMIFGVAALICAAVSLVLDYFGLSTPYVYISTGVFLLVFVWFVVDYRRALTKFF